MSATSNIKNKFDIYCAFNDIAYDFILNQIDDTLFSYKLILDKKNIIIDPQFHDDKLKAKDSILKLWYYNYMAPKYANYNIEPPDPSQLPKISI